MTTVGDDRNPYGKRIKAAREDRHLTLQNVADGLGLNGPKAYQRYETGESKPTLEFLEATAQVFRMTLPELLSYGLGSGHAEHVEDHAFGPGNAYYDTSKKLVASLEAQVEHLEGEVAFLRSELKKARAAS